MIDLDIDPLNEDMRLLSHRILDMQENERRHLSHYLQDDIGQMLVGVILRLESLEQETKGDMKQLDTDITKTKALAEDALETVKRSADLHQTP